MRGCGWRSSARRRTEPARFSACWPTDAAFRKTAAGRSLLVTLAGQIGAANSPHDLVARRQGAGRPGRDRQGAGPRAGPGPDRASCRRRRAPGWPAAGRARRGPSSPTCSATLAPRPLDDRAARRRPRRRRPRARPGRVRDVQRPRSPTCSPSRQPPEVQTAAVETLARFDDAGRGHDPADRLAGPESPRCAPRPPRRCSPAPPGSTPSSTRWSRARSAARDVDPARIALLKSYPDPKVRDPRRQSCSPAPAWPAAQDVVAAYQQGAALKGDARQGQDRSSRRTAPPATGSKASASRRRRPGRHPRPRAGGGAAQHPRPQPRGEAAVPQLRPRHRQDGRTLTGMITAETANSLTLRRADGIEETVLRLRHRGAAQHRPVVHAGGPGEANRRAGDGGFAGVFAIGKVSF